MQDTFVFYQIIDSNGGLLTNAITLVARKNERTPGDEVILAADHEMQIANLPKAGGFMFGPRYFRYQHTCFDPIKFMDQHAINMELFRPDKQRYPIPYCKPFPEPGSLVIKSFQVNNFVFVIKRTTNLTLQQVLALPAGQQARHCDLKMEVFEIIAHLKREGNIADLPPISLSEPHPIPVRVDYSLHYHGYTKLLIQPKINSPVRKLQSFMRQAVVKSRCLRRQNLLTLCMTTSEGLAQVIDCGVLRALIAPHVLSPRRCYAV